ncbi:beta strand repeat-containing protein [Cetobacterium ceti]
MFKYLYKWLMVLFLLFSGMVYGAPAPGNAIIGTQATLSYTDTNAQVVTVQSNTVEVTVNEVRGVSVTPNTADYSARPGEYISFPVTVNNTGNMADVYKIYTANDSNLPEISFTIDTNGNGVIDAGETTVLQPFDNLPSIDGGGSLSLVVRGRISPNATIGSTQTFIVHAKSINDTNIVAWNNNRFAIAEVADVMVTKSFGATGVADALLYVLQISNPSSVAATDLVITDIIPNDLEFDTTGGIWTPINSTTTKNVTYTDDGPEATSNDVELKVVNGVLTLKVLNVAANFDGTTGGKLVFRMKPKAGVAPGTKITNVASYVYNNGSTTTTPKNTNFLVYQVPSVAEGVEIINDETLSAAAGDYITIPQTVINRGQADDQYNLSVEQNANIVNVKFYVDENGDGIKNSNEDTPIGVTPIINEGESINILMVGQVAGGTPLGTQTFRIYARSINFNQSDFSDITLNVFQAGELVTISPEKTISGESGGEIMAHQIVKNLSNENTSYYLYVDDNELLDVKFFLDENSDGVRQPTENTQLTSPLDVNAGAEKHVFMVATLPTGLAPGSTRNFRIYARSIYNQNILDWSGVTVNITTAGAFMEVTKSIGETAVPGAFIYQFDIKNVGSANATNFTLTDNLPAGIIPDLDIGVWRASAGASFVNVTVADDGIEANAGFVTFKIVDGVLTLTRTEHPGNGSEARLVVRFRPTSAIMAGSTITNQATFSYDNGQGSTLNGTTNSLNYTFPSQAIGAIKKEAIQDPNNPGQFIYKFKFLNTGDLAATGFKMTDALPDTVEIVGTTAQWQPVTQTAEKTITLANDGPEVVSNEVNLYTTNDGVRDTVHFEFINGLQPNTTEATDGGILKVTVRPKAGVEPGTVITNVAGFEYNNGFDGVVTGEVSSQATYTVGGPNMNITKKIGETSVPGAFVYVFEFSNTGNAPATDLVLTDTLPSGIVLDKEPSTAWRVPINGASKIITPEDDGIEANAGAVTYKVVNGEITFTHNNFAAGATAQLDIRVRPVVGLSSGTVVSNQASYTFTGVGGIVNRTTDSVDYTIPSRALAGIKKEAIAHPNDPGKFIYKFKFTNTGDVAAGNLVMIDALPDTVEIVGTTAQWQPVTQTAEKTITLANDGPEVVSNEVNLYTTNDGVRDTVHFTFINGLQPNTTEATNGGILKIEVKPKAGTAPGTLITNVAEFSYDSGFDGTVSNQLSTQANYTVPQGPNMNVVKSIGNTSVPGAYVYVFNITNTGTAIATDFTLTDTLPSGIVLDNEPSTAWKFQAGGSSAIITPTDDGIEANAPHVTYKVVNGVITFTHDEFLTTMNSQLDIRVRPVAGLASGTVVSNQATYTFTDGGGTLRTKTTDTVDYTIPSQALFGVNKTAEVDPNDSTRFIYKFKVFNTGDANATSVVITDTLPTEVDVVGTTAQWQPVTQTVEKTITLADDGQEVVSDEVNLKVVNGVMTFTITSVKANHPENGTGGLLKLYVKPKSTVASGTVISNTAEFSYNNGDDGVVSNRASSTATYTVPSLGLGVDIVADRTYNVAKGEYINIPQTIKNIGDGADTYLVRLRDSSDAINEDKFFIDDNGDGILQYNETTQLSTSGGQFTGTTPSIPAGGELHIIVQGRVNNTTALSTGTHTFNVEATSKTNSTIKDQTTITLNVANAGELVSIQPDVTMTVGRGTSIIIPQTIINKTNTQQTYSLDLSQTPVFLNYKYVIDDNGDGVREGNEVTEFTTTPVIPGNGQLKFFLIGTLRGDLGSSETFRIFARSTTNTNALDWTTVNLTVTDPPTGSSNIVIDKNIGTSAVAGTFVYEFKIRNTSSTASGVVELVDEFSPGIEPDSQFGRWFPVGGGSKDVNSDDNGLEPNSNDIAFIYKDGKMTLRIVTMPGNSEATLHFRVRPVSGVTPGTVFENTAFYRYEPTPGVFPTVDAFTNTATYTVPSQAIAAVRKEAIAHPTNAGQFIYKFKFTNTGDINAAGFTMTDALPDNVEVVGTTAQWQPITWTEEKTITLANDGPEVVSDEVNLYTTNDGTRDTIHFTFVNGIQPNTTEAIDGGILKVVVQPKAGVAAGTTITNVAEFTYNNGSGTVTRTSNTAYYVVNDAAVNITKSIGTTAVPGAFVYVFDMVNVGTLNSKFVTITDQLPDGIIPDISSGVWVAPSGNNISITIADDGIEPGAGDVEFSVINGKLQFQLNSLGAGKSARLALRVRPESTVAPGSKVTNQADYSFQTSTGFTYYRTTNIVEYTIPGAPAGAGVVVEKSVQPNAFPGTYKYRFFIKNPTGVAGSNLTVTDTLPTGIDFFEADAKWVPQRSTEVKTITGADDGVEANASWVTYKADTTAKTLEFTLQVIEANRGDSAVGGYFEITIKPQASLAPGTVVNNTASYTFNDQPSGGGVVKTAETNTASLTIPNVNRANINVVKSIGATSTPGAFVYVFEIENTGGAGANFELVDDIDTNVIPDITTGVWFTYGSSTGVSLSNAADGPNNDGVDYSLVNNRLILKLATVPANSGKAMLHVRMKPAAGVPNGTVVTNSANYGYNDGIENVTVQATNTVAYEIKERANVSISKELGGTAVPGAFVYVFKITNSTGAQGQSLTITDNLPVNAVPDISSGVWVPFGSSSGVSITNADDGTEANASGVTFKVVNNVLTFTLNTVPGNVTAQSVGGYLALRMRPVSGTAPGTVITNVASYTYDNGNFITLPVNTNSLDYTVPQAGVDVRVDPDVTRDAALGEQLVIAQTITNQGTSADTYNLTVQNAEEIDNVKFYVDANGDGIRQVTETTEVTTTPSIAAGGTYKFFMVGRVNAGTTVGAHDFRIYVTSTTSSSIFDWSQINLNVYQAGATVSLAPEVTLSPAPGETVTFAQTITNNQANGDTFTLSAEENMVLENVKFYFDANGDGIRQAGETTEITTTPDVSGGGGTYKFFVVGTVKNSATGTETLRIYARSTTNNTAVDWSGVTLNISTNVAIFTINKSIGVTAVPGAYVYVFDMTNTGPVNATNVVMTDVLPEGVVPDISNALWKASASASYVSLTNADDGVETNAGFVTFKVVGRNLEFTRTIHGAQSTATLVLRVRPTSGVAAGSVLSNTANYSYNNGQAVINKTTNTVNYTVPSQAIVGVKKYIGETAVPGAFVYVFEITNTGDVAGTNLVLTDNLPSNVVLDDVNGVWKNFGSTSSIAITVADDGEEANAPGINFKVVNNQLTATVASVPAGVVAANNGGEFHLRVKPAVGTFPGEEIRNEGTFSYNNGTGVVTGRSTGAAVYTVPAGTASLTLQKLQALDANGDNVIEGTYGTGALAANPGTKIFYKLIVTNTGTGTASNVIIEDNVAQYTTLTYGDGTVSDKGKPSWRIGTGGTFTEVGTKPADGGTGLIKATIPSLGAGQTVELFYNVKVDQ